MKIKLKVFLPTIVMMLFALSLTGYAHGKHHEHESDGIKANISLENPSSIPVDDSLISRWLEKRLTEMPQSLEAAGSAKYVSGAAWVQDFGGGWCNECGCWLLHGPDPNGTPERDIGHMYVCSGGRQDMGCIMPFDHCCVSTDGDGQPN